MIRERRPPPSRREGVFSFLPHAGSKSRRVGGVAFRAMAAKPKPKPRAKPKPKRGRGQPPAISRMIKVRDPDTGEERTTRVADLIVELLSRGLYVEDAAAYCKISRTAVFDAIARGEEFADTPRSEIPESERLWADFAVEVGKARAEAVEIALSTIRNAAISGQWQAAAWFLERTRPGRYARLERREISGPDGGAISLLDLEREVADEEKK